MNYVSRHENILFQCPDFQISETLECGQCFRFTKDDGQTYTVIAHGKVLHLSQQGDEVRLYPCTAEEFETVWIPYFDLDRDYASIKQKLSATDPVLESATAYAGGIHLVNQDVWECLLSFIISQNMNIPRIKQIIANICEKYGDEIPETNAYAFPPPDKLAAADIPSLALCKTGFRAKYLADAIRRVNSGELDISNTQAYSTAELRSKLLSVYGVGEKVADCVMLYSCGRYEVFPTDVWVKRVVQNLYFGGRDMPIKEIHAFAEDRFADDHGHEYPVRKRHHHPEGRALARPRPQLCREMAENVQNDDEKQPDKWIVPVARQQSGRNGRGHVVDHVPRQSRVHHVLADEGDGIFRNNLHSPEKKADKYQ